MHVLPWDDVADAPGNQHIIDTWCWCKPSLQPKDMPDDVPLWNHHDATWPGSAERLQ